MSKIYGRGYDVYQFYKTISERKIPKYKEHDVKKCSWSEITASSEKIEIYLSKKTIDFLESKEIKITRNIFSRSIMTQIPCPSFDERIIEFPSLIPREEYKRNFNFYLGMLLSGYKEDLDDEVYGIKEEFDDVLPLLLEYLYLKEAGKADEFLSKHFNEIRYTGKSYIKAYDEYNDFIKFRNDSDTSDLDPVRLERFKQLCIDKEHYMNEGIRDCLTPISSLDSVISIYEQIKSPSEYKELIERLMVNEKGNRGLILQDMGIETYGFKQLRKVLDNNYNCKK